MEEDDFEFDGDESYVPPDDIDPNKLQAKKEEEGGGFILWFWTQK